MANLFSINNGKITYNNVSTKDVNNILEKNKKNKIKKLEKTYKNASQIVDDNTQKIGNYLNENGQNVNINKPFQANLISNKKINDSKKNLNGRVTLQDVVQEHTNLMNTDEAKELKNNLRISKNEKAWAGYNLNQAKVENEKTTFADKTIGNVTRGVVDLFSNMTDSRDVVDGKGNTIRLPSYNELKQQKVSKDYKTGIGKFLGDATYNISKIGASTLINVPTLGIGGTSIYWSDMYFDSYHNAKNQGYSEDRAFAYALGNAGFEFITGKFLGSATKGLTGGQTSQLSNAISNGINKLISNPKMSSVIGNAGSEAVEEFLQEYIENINRLITLEGSTNAEDYIDTILNKEILKDAIYSAGIGALSGGTLGSINNTEGKNVNSNTKLFKEFKTQLEETKNNLKNKNEIAKYDKVIKSIDDYLQRPFGNDAKAQTQIPTVQDIVAQENTKKQIAPTGLPIDNQSASRFVEQPVSEKNITQQIESVNSTNNDNLVKYTNHEIDNFKNGRVKIANNLNDIDIFVESAKKAPSNAKLYFGKIGSNIANKIKLKLGVEIENYNLSLPANAINHILKNHGDIKTESDRGQVAINDNDFKLIPKIVTEFDDVTDSGLTTEGKNVITFKKRIGDTFYLVNYVSNKNHNLEVKTMYKQKKKNSATASDELNPQSWTSETDSGTSSFSDNNIPQINENVKLPVISNNNIQNNENDTNKVTDIDSELETNNKDKTAQLLDKRPLEKQKGLNVELNKIYQKIVDKGKYVADLSNKTGNKELYTKYDQMGTARGTAEYSIGVEQVNNEGKKIGKSLIDIWEPITESGKEFDFSMYLLHKHNIDRYAQGKPVFGEKITSEISQEEVLKYEQNNPEFIKWAKDINKYNRNLLQNMVDAGITSEESQKYYNDTYSNYVRIYRDITGNSPVTINNGKIKVNSPIKTAKGGNQNILPLKDSMAQQTLEVTSAIRRNQFGLELLETLGNGKEVTEYGKEIIEKNDDGTYSFTVFKDGKPVKMEIDEGLYESIKPSKKSQIEDLLPVKGARNLLKFQRGLITDKNPFFLLRNFFKDLGDAPLNSKYTSKFFPNFSRAYYEIITNGEYAKLYKGLGGYQQSYFDNDAGLKIPSKNKVNKFVRAIQNLNQAVEMAPRLAEFISSIEAGETIQSSMYNAAEITTNFKRGGDVTKALNRNFSNFLNASIQGFDKQFRNFTGQNGAKGYINLLSKAVVFGVLPSMLNHLLLDDDEDYEDLPDYIKDNYYLFKTDDNKFIRIPKGRVISVFGNAAYRTYEYLQGNKNAYKGFIENAITNVAPNNPIGSNVLSPFIQVSTNKSWNGSEIVPKRLQDLPAEEQYDEKTDELSKSIGKIFNISPKKINYLLDQYSGVFGDTLLPMLTPQAENNPLTSAFTVNSVTTNKYSSEFYDIQDEVTKKANSVNSTITDELQKKYLNSVQTEMSELYKEKRELQMSDVKDSEKRRLVEKIQSEINRIAEEGINNYKKVTSYSNYSKVSDKEYFLNSKNEWTKVDDEELEELNDLNMQDRDKNKYFKTKVQIGVIKSDDNKESTVKHTEIANLVINSGLSDEYKGYLYGKYYSNEKVIKSILDAGIKFDEFIKFNSQEFTTNYYTNGKAVTNSRRNKVINYVNSLNLSVAQKAILIKMEYSSYDKYDKQIVSYINKMNYSKYEKASLLKNFGFDNYDKYLISYVNNMKINKIEKEKILEEMGFTIRNGRVYS